MSPLLLYLVPNDAYFYSHRMPMARAAQQAGFDVGLVTGSTTCRDQIEADGIRVFPCRITQGGTNPFREIRAVWDLIRIYRRESPALVHHVTVKAILWGAAAAWLCRVPRVINAFAGLGYIFTADDVRARLLRLGIQPVLRFLLRRRGSTTLVQNPDDGARLDALGLTRPESTVLIPGSGVDTDRFAARPLPDTSGEIICVFSGRMIGIKGLPTLRAAFDILRTRAPSLCLWLCGAPDPNNPGSWTAQDLRAWEAAAPNVVWKGHQDRMETIWAQAHLAIQPSTGGEGIPKALLEAAACGRGIVASDVPGCREVVEQGCNGLLTPPGEAQALADALEGVARNPDILRAWAEASRALVLEKGFSAQAVTRATRTLYEDLVSEYEVKNVCSPSP